MQPKQKQSAKMVSGKLPGYSNLTKYVSRAWMLP